MDQHRDIGSRLELFVDDWLIDRMDGADLKLHHPVKREVAVPFDAPWEGRESSFATVVLDGDKYRLWYRGVSREGIDSGVKGLERGAYAESDDGVRWVKPELGLVEFEGSKVNNLVWEDTGGNLAPFIDGNPNAKPDERYKAIVRTREVFALSSPDGLRWEHMRDEPILTEGPFDSHNVAMWDSHRGEYAVFTRGVGGTEGSFKGGVRWIRKATSEDFLSWTSLKPIDAGDTPFEHLYTNATTPYFRAPHMFLAMPRRFVPGRQVDPDWPVDALTEAVFMSSRDGLNWDRRFMGAFIRPGLDQNNWTDRNTTPAAGIVPTGPDEISIYYGEHFRRPTNRLRRATLRTDGFMSVYAPFGGGEMVTKPILFEGSRLTINYSTSVAGHVLVEVQDAEGRPIDGFGLDDCEEIFGDEIERTVAWRGGSDLSGLAGQPVQLRFAVKEADLYSVQFK